MKSLSNLFRVGPGPSSSHTIAPYNAAQAFLRLLGKEKVDAIKVYFYGSLALTGVGHGSDRAVCSVFKKIPTEVICDVNTRKPHPLTMMFQAYGNGKIVKETSYCSLGGGEIHSDDDPSVNEVEIYPFRNFEEIKKAIQEEGFSGMKELCLYYEGSFIDDYLLGCVKHMLSSVRRGLAASGQIPANSNPRLQISRTAGTIYKKAKTIRPLGEKKTMYLSSYAYAVAEGSACGDLVVTSPTCGSSGVLPAALYYLHYNKGVTLEKLRDALYVAGMIGNVVKQNASIAGSVGGCQAEIGTACSMAAAALAYCDGLSVYQIEYAAECAMEHLLGLSCDPVDGYVIIPCIERNGMGALRAEEAFLYSKYIAPNHHNQVSFDDVVVVMKMTGDSLAEEYKETAKGGLASLLKKTNC